MHPATSSFVVQATEADRPSFQRTTAELNTRIGFLLVALDNPTTTSAIEAQ